MALTILGMAIVVIIQLASANTRSITKTDAYTKSVLKADAKMSEFMDRTDLTEGQWTEQTEDGYAIRYSVEETLGERTEELPLKMLRVDLTLVNTTGLRQPVTTLHGMKLVKKETQAQVKEKSATH